MSEYTPTTAEVKQRYEDARYQFTPGRLEQTRAEFDRWLAEVERAAAARALDWLKIILNGQGWHEAAEVAKARAAEIRGAENDEQMHQQ